MARSGLQPNEASRRDGRHPPDLKGIFLLAAFGLAACNPLCEQCQAVDAAVQTHCDAEVEPLYPIDRPGVWWRHRVCDIETNRLECPDKVVVAAPATNVPGRERVLAVPVDSIQAPGHSVRWQEFTSEGVVRRHLDESFNEEGQRVGLTWYCPFELRVPADAGTCEAEHWIENFVKLKVTAGPEVDFQDCARAVDPDRCAVLSEPPGCAFVRTPVRRAWRVEDDNETLTLPGGYGPFENVVRYAIWETQGDQTFKSHFWWAPGRGKIMESDGEEGTLEVLVEACLQDCGPHPSDEVAQHTCDQAACPPIPEALFE